MRQSHTPLPWVELPNGDGIEDVLHWFESEGWFFHDSANNIPFIVRAVNSHYDLLEALKCFVSSFASGQREKCDYALVLAKAAIAKAEEATQ